MVMRRERLGAFHASRLSVARKLLRRMHREEWQIRLEQFDLTDDGIGTAVYVVETPAADLSLVCVRGPDLSQRTQSSPPRADPWDTSFVLTEGIPDQEEMAHLSQNAPLQEAGRFSPDNLILCRAAKCEDTFDRTVACLAEGQQPNKTNSGPGGALLRTTGFFGNGKLGLADYSRTLRLPGISGPFMAEMLVQYLVREYSFDLVDRLAALKTRASSARLTKSSKRRFGVGNTTNLGCIAFVIGNPFLLHTWILERERSISRIRHIRKIKKHQAQVFHDLLRQVRVQSDDWRPTDPRQIDKVAIVRQELAALIQYVAEEHPYWWQQEQPWVELLDEVERTYSIETQELINSIVLEPYPNLIDCHSDGSLVRREEHVDPDMTLSTLLGLIERQYGWALALDFSDPRSDALCWYVSKQESEVRLSQRFDALSPQQELLMGMAREIVRLKTAILDEKLNQRDTSVGRFLRQRPECRAAVRRVQTIAEAPYGEIRENLLHEDTVPEDILRCKLAFLGGSTFETRPGHRIYTDMFRGAPSAERIHLDDPDDWMFKSTELSG